MAIESMTQTSYNRIGILRRSFIEAWLYYFIVNAIMAATKEKVMQGLGWKAVILTFFSVSTLYQAHGSEVEQPAVQQFNGTSASVVCSPTQPASSTINNVSTTDRSIRNASKSHSINIGNNSTKPLASPISTSVTVSNSCEPSHFANSDSATSTVLTAALISIIKKSDKDQQNDSGDGWKTLEKFAPVLQTLIWALLIFFLAKRFAQPLSEMLRTAGRRLGKLHIKTPYGEVFADLEPLSIEKQKYNAGQAANAHSPTDDNPVPSTTTTQAANAQSPSSDGPSPSPTISGLPEFSQVPNSRAVFMKMYYEAEDFVIRTLQQEFRTTIAQNMRTGTGIEMDGFFLSEDTPHVIEVKLIRSPNSLSHLRESVTHLVLRLKQDPRFENVQIILAIVSVEEISETKKLRFEARLVEIGATIQVRWFKFSELQRKFVE